MKQFVNFWIKDDDSEEVIQYTYRAGVSGEIEIERLCEGLNILTVYFRKLNALNKELDFDDESTEIMLANLPIQQSTVKELDGLKIGLKKGWTNKQMFTMLSLRDGEPINNNRIEFKLREDGSINVLWTGVFTSYQSGEDVGRFELNLIAFEKKDLITPLCENNEILISHFKSK